MPGPRAASPRRPAAPHPYLDAPRPRAYAHRGWHLGELTGLENTMVAFGRATDATGRLAARTAAELARVRVRGAHRSAPIPHLHDVLAALPATRVTVELKSAAAVRPVLDVLDRLDAWDRVCVGGFHEPWLRAARRLAGGALFTSMAQHSVAALRLQGWHPRLHGVLGTRVHGDLAQLPHRFGGVTVVDADVLRAAHAGGREVHVWTVDDPREMAGLLDLGVDGVLTDRPDVLRALLVARGAWAV